MMYDANLISEQIIFVQCLFMDVEQLFVPKVKSLFIVNGFILSQLT